MVISGNGKGMGNRARTGIGISALQKTFRELTGTLQLSSAPEKGTELSL